MFDHRADTFCLVTSDSDFLPPPQASGPRIHGVHCRGAKDPGCPAQRLRS
ncbi:hypothetical protein [Xanthomonas arboricola]|nr:hypothetical protein [Xanthomonas arboricola]